ncbi:ATP-binding cassette domain-containing protein [Bifidobacterium sp. M0353]|uniref:ATP-binding cassette domain-containing protein n=1 Tax=Bifidobacterium sp. M0353 TaxID=2751006 RepID=UPI00359C7034
MAYTDGNNDPQLAVVTQGLIKAYGDFKAVDGLNLQVPAGGVYGLLGPNGAGKSTTMKLLLELTKPTAGSMWLLGQQVGNKSTIQPGLVGTTTRHNAPKPYERSDGYTMEHL